MFGIFFADDSRQTRPSRPGMGPLVAAGGICVPAEKVGPLGRAIEEVCKEYGFPPGQQFKWSPGPELWMRDNLKYGRRESFFLKILGIVQASGARASVIVDDVNHKPAVKGASYEEDVTSMLMERVQWQLVGMQCEGMVITDRPGGGRSDEDRFLGTCLETLQRGTTFLKLDRIVLNVVPSPARLIRLLQVADLVTGCTTAQVGGEDCYSPRVFQDGVLPMLSSSDSRIGGVGLKIHPDYRYANRYRWLLGDTFLKRGSVGTTLPMREMPYSKDALTV